ncbi:glycoside hydrolase family 3 N-terminal domain-containing protein [Streptomyces sp. CA-288835]|uniref:glycoside hydrolase family 3 N-terminal domain-containing protein n=1 Tax=Streptomyces sp. CA-288835 TaxID=3240069 RepID=UPI003D8DA8DC
MSKRIDNLVEGLTLDERFAMLHQYAPAVPRLGIAPSAPAARPCTASPGPGWRQASAPVLNLLRDPRWGRNEEGYSEDPVYTARIGEAFCSGLSGCHQTYLRAAPVFKHFLAYEDDRRTTSSGLRPCVLQEYDLAAFRPVVASGAATGAMAARTTWSTAVPVT